MASVAVLIKRKGGGGIYVRLLAAISRFFEVFLVCAQGVLRRTHLAGPLVLLRANRGCPCERDSFLASESRGR